jgi:hypothetical protein
MLNYKVRVTNPKGKANEYGTYGFYTPGHAVYFLADVMNGMAGTWRVEWFTVHRDTKEEKRVQTDVFEISLKRRAPIRRNPALVHDVVYRSIPSWPACKPASAA